jgi:SpoVK/Ycf46/Vps4 family AAA+-type ATPase
MDDFTFSALRAALDTSPDNAALRVVLIKAALERGDAAAAAALAAPLDPAPLPPEDRATAARALLAGGDAQRALAAAEGDDPALLLLRARALAALGRTEEAKGAYRAAVAQNPALEDLELSALLGARVVELETSAGRAPVRLTVVSNDDTGAEEVRRVIAPAARKVTFADVGGLEAVKEQIRRRIVLPFQKPSLFQRFRKRAGGGILLYGPPGCGKTLLARATAGECEAAFFDVAISDVLDMYIGESERKLHALFEEARRKAPAVLFFDELEALGGKRQYSREATSAKLVSQFLAEMDGFAQANGGVLVLGSTNVPWAVDPAFRRPGRFDRVLFVPPPDAPAREAILRLLLDGRPVADDVRPELLARATSTFSGADLSNLIETASDLAIQESLAAGREVPIRMAQLEAALKEVKPTTLEWLTTARNYARYSNESGQYDDVLAFLKQHGRE